jgi:uncharacterized protein YbgA (DUF1722 family)
VKNNFLHSDPEKVVVGEKDAVNFVIDRFSHVKKSKKIGELVEFQTMNKYMLMVHNQEELKILGKMVASYKKIPIMDILTHYEVHLKIALSKEPTTKTHFNALMHIFGYFSKHFTSTEKDLYHELLSQFKNDEITVGKMLSEIGPLIYRFNDTYLARQTYFLLYADPRPGVLFAVFNDKI